MVMTGVWILELIRLLPWFLGMPVKAERAEGASALRRIDGTLARALRRAPAGMGRRPLPGCCIRGASCHGVMEKREDGL